MKPITESFEMAIWRDALHRWAVCLAWSAARGADTSRAEDRYTDTLRCLICALGLDR